MPKLLCLIEFTFTERNLEQTGLPNDLQSSTCVNESRLDDESQANSTNIAPEPDNTVEVYNNESSTAAPASDEEQSTNVTNPTENNAESRNLLGGKIICSTEYLVS